MKSAGIWHVILLLILASLVAGAIQLAILFLIVWGLLFRTTETIGVLIFFFILGLIGRCPWVGVAMLALSVPLLWLRRCEPKAYSRQQQRLFGGVSDREDHH